MPPVLKVCCLWLALSWGGFSCAFGDESDPAEKWVGAYSWLQTGERLAASEQWPLAMGSYIEAHRQMDEIQKQHPEYEPEVVSYRLERLEEMIAETQEKLASGDQEIMTKFLDFIDSYEEGLRNRYLNRFTAALNHLDIAKVLLDEIIYEKPNEFRDAVDTQYMILHDSIAWIDLQITVKERSRPANFVGDGVEWGTTQFVKEKDLPGEGDTILTSGALFPGLPDPELVRDLQRKPAASVGETPEVEEAEKTPSQGIPAFRMSSKQKGIPSPEKTDAEE